MRRSLLLITALLFIPCLFAGEKLGSFSNKVPLHTIGYVEGVQDLITLEFAEPDNLMDQHGNLIVKTPQSHFGIPVFGAEVIEFEGAKGREFSGRFGVVGNLEIEPRVDLDDAVEMVAGYLPESTLSGELYIYPAETGARLVWLIEETAEFSRWRVFVDAHTKEIINAYNNIQHNERGRSDQKGDELIPIDPDEGPIYIPANGTGTGVLGDTKTVEALQFIFGTFTNFRMQRSENGVTRYTRTANNGTSLPGSLLIGSDNVWNNANERSAVDAHFYTGIALDFYRTRLNRNSYNNSGASVTSTVRYSSNYVNAFWNGSQLVYGDGDGVNSTGLAGALDVVAHEFSHAVTEHSSGLIYQNESGALNEAFSDIMGAAAEFYYQPGQFDWMIGEDVWTPGTAGDALRYMDDPVADGISRDHYSTRYTGTGDNGGVHINSGIANLAFQLTVDGGSHPRRSGGPTITGIGMDTAMQIYYNAFTSLSSSATFMDARNACIAAANSYPVNVREAVTNAWAAVGVGGVFTNTLSAPTLRLFSDCGFGNLFWNSVSGATQYKIYRSTSSSSSTATLYRTTSATSLGVLINNTVYYYWVKACTPSICSNFSNRVIARNLNRLIIDCR